MDDDADLVARMRDDPDAFERFYRRHLARVRRFAARRCHQPADVADVVSTTFVTIVDAAAGYDPRRGPVVPWMLGIAHHEILDLHRGQTRQQRLAVAVAGRIGPSEDDYARLEAQIDAERAARALRRGLDRAPKALRELVEVMVEEDLTATEAATVLGIRPVTARVRLMRARRLLRPDSPHGHETVPRETEETA